MPPGAWRSGGVEVAVSPGGQARDRQIALRAPGAAGLSKLGLAQRADIDQRTVTFIENGINVPSISTLHSLCAALEITGTTVVSKADRAARGPE